nr:immunoglobulin heavy chain junction region [Macaca mulatta]MOW47381.1 immunoglobulin heavy chain junction region [Macaca mulatta]MOW48799.1 immunoglobulin heavy chain junction region [Macaca mulatta]
CARDSWGYSFFDYW